MSQLCEILFLQIQADVKLSGGYLKGTALSIVFNPTYNVHCEALHTHYSLYVIMHTYHNFEHYVQLYIKFTHGNSHSFVARQFLSVIYALLSVIFAMGHVRECERMTNMGYGHRLIKSLREIMTAEEVA